MGNFLVLIYNWKVLKNLELNLVEVNYSVFFY